MEKNKFFMGLMVLIFTLVCGFAVNAAVVINEVLANPTGAEPANEFIELYNDGSSAVNISGYRLNDTDSTYAFPDTTEIAASGFLVFYGSVTGMTLDNAADTVYLLDVTNTTLDSISYTGTTEGSSIGSRPDGSTNIVAFTVPTPNATNNRAPNLTTSISTISWNEDATTTIDLDSYFTDPDADSMSYSATSVNNINVSINQTDGVVTFTPDTNFAGTRYVVFTATDGLLSTNSNNVTLTVNNVNDAPVIASTAVTTATEDTAYSYSVVATDADSDNLSYSITTYPTGMTISTAGVISWTPSTNGTYAVTASVSDGTVSATQSWNITVSEGIKLEIYDLDVKVDDKTSSGLSDGRTISKDAEPGSTVTFKVEVKNTYSDEVDIEIEDIVITVTIEGIDDGEDLDEETDDFNLDADKKKKKSLTFDIPFLVEKDSYDVIIKVEGTDEDGKDHELEWKLVLDVDKSNHELMIYKADLTSDTLECRRTTNLNVEIINIGEEDEDEVVVEVQSDELGIDYYVVDIELDAGSDEDSVYENSFDITLPEDLAAGSYSIKITTYRDTTRVEDTKTVTLIVEECITVAEEEEEEEKIVDVEYIQEPAVTAAPVTHRTGELAESPTYVAVLVAMLIVIFGGVIYSVGLLLKK